MKLHTSLPPLPPAGWFTSSLAVAQSPREHCRHVATGSKFGSIRILSIIVFPGKLTAKLAFVPYPGASSSIDNNDMNSKAETCEILQKKLEDCRMGKERLIPKKAKGLTKCYSTHCTFLLQVIFTTSQHLEGGDARETLAASVHLTNVWPLSINIHQHDYILFAYDLHVISILFTYDLDMIYMLFTYHLRIF